MFATRNQYALEALDADASYCRSLTALVSPTDGPIALACEALQAAWETIVWNDPRSHAPVSDEDTLFEDIPF